MTGRPLNFEPVGQDRSALVIGAVFSVTAHVVAMALVAGATLRPTEPDDLSRRARETRDQTESLEPSEPVVHAGIRRSDAVTINWIGFERATEHAAERSVVEQPSVDPAPGVPGMPASSPPSASSTSQDSDAPSEQAAQVASESSAEAARGEPEPTPSSVARAPDPVPPPVSPIDPASDLLLRDRLEPQVALLAPQEPVPGSNPLQRSEPGRDTEMPRPSPPPGEPESAPPAARSSASPERSAEASAEPASAESAPERRPATGATDGRPAVEDEREADASSKDSTDRVVPGRVLAREGLEIITRRPRFRHTVDLTAPSRNPVVRIEFDRRGVVRHAEFVREGETVRNTGSAERDGPVLDAVHRWRASGAGLDELDPDDADARVVFTVELILNGR